MPQIDWLRKKLRSS